MTQLRTTKKCKVSAEHCCCCWITVSEEQHIHEEQVELVPCHHASRMCLDGWPPVIIMIAE